MLDSLRGVEEAETRQLVDESKLCEPREESGINMLLHETAYYWAMHLLHGKDDSENYWFHNPDLWPPPDDYYDCKEWVNNNKDI